MNLNAWLTLLVGFTGPVVAVLITLWIERRRQTRDARHLLVKQMFSTRHLVSDPAYSQAINLTEIEFNDDRKVMSALARYRQLINVPPQNTQAAADRHHREIIAAQVKLLAAMMRSIGLNVSEADMPNDAYVAQGYIARETLFLDAMQAQKRFAEALERVAAAQEAMLGMATTPIDDEPPILEPQV